MFFPPTICWACLVERLTTLVVLRASVFTDFFMVIVVKLVVVWFVCCFVVVIDDTKVQGREAD
jgi:hypothetical protein